jgi:predicted RNA methylase
MTENLEESLYDLKEPVDMVIMNPPFGTKIKGIDMVFLQKAIEVRHPFFFPKLFFRFCFFGSI